MDIDVLFSFKNYVIIRDNITNYIWLYSYNKPLCYYDKYTGINLIKENIETQTNKKHLSVFKKFIKDKG